MQLATVTFSATASATEVFGAFFNLHQVLWGGLDNLNFDFGTAKDFGATSKNLRPHKVKFHAPHGGHDHTLAGRKLAAESLRKANLDVNSLSVLWASYFNDFINPNIKYVIMGVKIVMDGDTQHDGSGAYGANEARAVKLPTVPSVVISQTAGNEATLDLVRLGTHESDYWNANETNFRVVAYFLTPQVKFTDSTVQSTWIYSSGAGSGDWYAHGAAAFGGGNYGIHGVLVARYTAPEGD